MVFPKESGNGMTPAEFNAIGQSVAFSSKITNVEASVTTSTATTAASGANVTYDKDTDEYSGIVSVTLKIEKLTS